MSPICHVHKAWNDSWWMDQEGSDLHNGLIPRWAHTLMDYWEVISNLREWALRGLLLGAISCPQLLPLHFLLPGCHEVSSFLCYVNLMLYFVSGPQQLRPSDHGLKSWAKINLSSFNFFSKILFLTVWKANYNSNHTDFFQIIYLHIKDKLKKKYWLLWKSCL
jgi:uncharacterized membrane protein